MTKAKAPCISVIVPVYNVEKYLTACIDSILAQTFTDFELLLVDDGSTDSSGSICDNYVEKDNRIRTFHQINGGSSYARNSGLKYATGKWIAFVDSDDKLGKEYLNDLYNASGEKIDLVIQSLTHIKENGESMFGEPKESEINEIYFSSEFRTLQRKWHLENKCQPVSKLFKRDIIKTNNIYFMHGVRFGEDFLFLFDYLDVIQGGVCISSKSNYFYIDRSNSLVHSCFSFSESLQFYYYSKKVFTRFANKYNCEIKDFDFIRNLHRTIMIAKSSKDLLRISCEDWKIFVKNFKPISIKTAIDKQIITYLHYFPSGLFLYLHLVGSFRKKLEKNNLWKIVNFLKK